MTPVLASGPPSSRARIRSRCGPMTFRSTPRICDLELFERVAGEDGAADADHAGPHLVDREKSASAPGAPPASARQTQERGHERGAGQWRLNHEWLRSPVIARADCGAFDRFAGRRLLRSVRARDADLFRRFGSMRRPRGRIGGGIGRPAEEAPRASNSDTRREDSRPLQPRLERLFLCLTRCGRSDDASAGLSRP